MSFHFDLQDVHFAYPDSHAPVLCGVNLQLSAGERLCLNGPNGSGKSTLLQLLVGLRRPTRGTISAFGMTPSTEADFRAVRCRAGYVFQDPDDQLFSPTVREDVAFGPLNIGKSQQEAEAIVARVLDQLGLSGFENRITYKLSGGERRLVSLATVLAMDPEVLILDEPTNALDEHTTERLTQILLSLPHSMIIVSHDPVFRQAVRTREVFMQAGRVVPERTAA
ncbi:energy-coupling factor ABC transporter ATP-binding protein [Pelagibacterium halotolerans]|uniref:ATPase component NikO of energizing module of nickel ECF transporter n=1 Tax=Pelagibacterium halotolerans (strain DSM 22347 / JCM 15775 / CGMCC 1.7692 / B2) TaxID=1082931 RepID=G4R720_PELHB|nr:ABC transporter ATP-binding protein [Pelagibacterium halotolerans]AEQ50174.1 ATPase component NikO of energizing module of nickel ECF transporter [Pelagibacterium halotolerans B2]QJR19818.1 ABC transporter ATP-binding protein [Pelagibacterium halotolerans]SEA49751.1 cobalt/nickel transport system ATP-binding protein [Pelagibacterium halotolerans]